ncbi:M14 family metallocarboxypeptidase [Shewanella sp. Isolate7]|uniref:M14 family metallopeptidase n=1 Tax=Shewanella sp. Isolate7 TaxID=2908528 RepID=UPI001EFE513C|nr:M14 family metallocarboxypeptidase [Shewanella sp. Isolate7]MCG9723114.1 M14 family metallocarboxypeptidase [Shewanella sp. Isolate7]
MENENTAQQGYWIGEAGKPWGEAEKAQWRAAQQKKRSYEQEVLSKFSQISEAFEAQQYGELSYDEGLYPLYGFKSRDWDQTKPTILVTGGVHGYETSGVQGALRFLIAKASEYSQDFNILVAPCVSPWGYETINRWNPEAIDPNRSFYADSPAQESRALMQWVASFNQPLMAHIDLHETTDTDNSEFRPALAARDAKVQTNWNIPDGFYLVGDSENPNDEMQAAIIEAVAKVTHIAPADEQGRLIGEPITQFGVINYATKALGLCCGFSDARYNTTTEVYPDSPLVDDENCIQAQVMAVSSAVDYIRTQAQSQSQG